MVQSHYQQILLAKSLISLLTERTIETLYALVYPNRIKNPTEAELLEVQTWLAALAEKYYENKFKHFRLLTYEKLLSKLELLPNSDHDTFLSNEGFPLRLFEALNGMDSFKELPGPVALQVKDTFDGEFIEVEFLAERIVAVLTAPQKGRAKTIYYLDEQLDQQPVVRYEINRNDLNFKRLQAYFDQLNWFLLKVNRHTIINVGFYQHKVGGGFRL